MCKILMVTEEGRGGGALGRIRLMAEALQEQLEILVLVPSSGKNYIQSLRDNGIAVVSTPMIPLNTNLGYFIKYVLFFIPEIWQIYKIIKRVDPDIVHTNGSWQIKGLIAARAAKVKCVWQMNDTYQPGAVLFFFKLLAGWPTAYIYASESTRQYYSRVSSKLGKRPFSVIQAPVKKISNIEKRDHVLQRGSLRLVLIGYINHHKGIDILLHALSELAGHDVVCDIVGPVIGTREIYKKGLDSISKKVGVNLNYLGYQTVDADLLSSYDFYICSSRREASPMAVWEAMTMGLPILSTPVGDIKYIVGDHSCGLVAKDLKSESLSSIIREALHVDQETYDIWSENCIKTARMFEYKNIAEQYLAFYTDIASA